MASIFIHDSLLADSGYYVTICLGSCYPRIVSQNKPLLPQVTFISVLYHSNRNCIDFIDCKIGIATQLYTHLFVWLDKLTKSMKDIAIEMYTKQKNN